jgi:hypothetical protein
VVTGFTPLGVSTAGRRSHSRARRPRSTLMLMARRAEDLPPTVVVIEDEFSTMSADEYRIALDRWLAEVDADEPIERPVSAADILRDIREHDET